MDKMYTWLIKNIISCSQGTITVSQVLFDISLHYTTGTTDMLSAAAVRQVNCSEAIENICFGASLLLILTARAERQRDGAGQRGDDM